MPPPVTRGGSANAAGVNVVDVQEAGVMDQIAVAHLPRWL